MDAYTFLISFFRGVTPGNYIELTFIHGNKELGLRPIIDIIEVGDSHALQAALDRAAHYNSQGWGIYFGVCPRKTMPTRGRRGSEDHVDTILGFWTELDSIKEGRTIESDLAKLQSSDFVPSFCVLSGGGVHAYWLLDQPFVMADDKRQLIKSAIRGIGEKFGGDTSVAEFARVLRIPGFVNTKPGRDANPVQFVPPAEKHRYSIDQLLAFAPPEKPKRPKQESHHDEKPDETRELAQLALDALAPWRRDDYKTWYQIGMILKTKFDDAGVTMWDNWSAGGEGYKEGECFRKSESFRGSGLGIGTLFKWATEDMPTWKPYKPETGRTARTIEAQDATTYEAIDTNWHDGVPTSVRAATVQYMPAAVASVFELWFEGSMRGDLEWETPVPIDYLYCLSTTYGRGLSRKQIQRGIKLGSDVFWTSTAHNESSIDSPMEDNKIGKLVQNVSQRQIYTPCRKLIGRKAVHYELLPRKMILANLAKLAIAPILEKHFPTELGIVPPIRIEFLKQLGCDENEAARLEKELDDKYGDLIASQKGYSLVLQRAKREFKRFERSLANPHSAPIPDGLSYANKSEYLRTCARAVLTQEGGSTQWSQSQWARVLGCSPRSLDGIFKAADIEVEKDQHCDVEIKTIEQLERIDLAYSKECEGYPSEVISSTKRDHFPFEPGQPMILWAGAQLESGATVTLRYQQAHKQHLLPVRKPKSLTYWRSLCQRVVIAIMIANPIPLKEQTKKKRKASKPKPTYGQKVINTMVEKFTNLKTDDATVIDPITGEYVDPTTDALLKALLATTPDPWADDPLVSALLAKGGVVTEVIQNQEVPIAA